MYGISADPKEQELELLKSIYSEDVNISYKDKG